MRYLILLILAGCSVQAEPPAKGLISECIDTRDGEHYSIHSENIHNQYIELPSGQACADAVDDTGQLRHVCSNENAWIKCKVHAATR